MLFLVNRENYGLKVDDGIEVNTEYLKEKGVSFYDSEHELNLALCDCLKLSLEEIEGGLPLIIYRDSSYYHVCDRGLLSDIDEQDISKYIAEYIL